MEETALHQPVMLQEVIEFFSPIATDAYYIDATFGRGGHTHALLAQGAKVIAFDHDQHAIEYGKKRFEQELHSGTLQLIRENFNKLTEKTKETIQNKHIEGILFDFGTSVDQLKDQNRGFSFDSDAQLDMRMDDRLGVKAKDLLMVLGEQQLADMFREFGGEEESHGIARAIVKQRAIEPIETTQQLSQLVSRVKQKKTGYLHPATKVFQALRIIVNNEIDNIQDALPQAIALLRSGGKLITISFHEGEDRIVKHTFKSWEQSRLGHIQTPKPLSPTDQEIQTNIRARSAKLRVFQKG